MNFLSNLPVLFRRAQQEWKEDSVFRLSAALAYYTIFSLSPLLVIVIAITGLVWQADPVRAQIIGQAYNLLGAEGAEFLGSLIANAGSPGRNIFALSIGTLTMLLGALAVFNELRHSLNSIWEIQAEKPGSLLQAAKKTLLERFTSFAMILGIGFLLLMTLAITVAVSAAQEIMGNAFLGSEFLLQTVNLAVSILMITILFAFAYKYLSDAQIAWRDVWIGAFITSLLFTLGKTVIGLYLGRSAIASVYGAAGSLVLILLWIYYSSQIFFFGAELIQVYANEYGSKTALRRRGTSLPPGAEDGNQPGTNPFLPPSSTGDTLTRDWQRERQSFPTGRILASMLIASFLLGIVITNFGLKRR